MGPHFHDCGCPSCVRDREIAKLAVALTRLVTGTNLLKLLRELR